VGTGGIFLDILGAVLIGVGVALQFANMFCDQLPDGSSAKTIRLLLKSRIFQLVGGFALVAGGIFLMTRL
jgi:hypothetical protein